MARIRTIKPEARKSFTLASWPREVRLAWHYLSMYLDDKGRGIDDVRLVVAECFPLDRDVTDRKVEGWLALMATIPKLNPDDEPALCRYTVGGRAYFHAPKWKKHQVINKPQPSHLPPCPIHEPEGLF